MVSLVPPLPRGTRRLGVGLLGLVCLVAPALASAAPPGRFVPLTLAELYAKRMRFEAGVPRISVGLMSGQEQLAVGGGPALRVMFDEGDLPKTLYLPEGARLSFRRLSATPARVAHWGVVHAHAMLDGERPDAVAKRWARGPHPVRVFEAGTIIAVGGKVLDTREWRVGVGGVPSRAEAEALLSGLGSDGHEGERFVHEELLAPPSGVIGIYDAAGKLIHKASDAVAITALDGGAVPVDEVEFGRGYRWHGRERRRYRGHLYVAIDGGGQLALVNSVDAETLLRGLVPAEIFASAPLEALKAQAVTARGEIFSKLAHRHFGDPFHLCSEQHCQVYAGAKLEHAATDRAVAETRGLLAVRPRADAKAPMRLVDSRYSSSCGGSSEANEVVWGTSPAESLRARIDGIGSDPALAAYAEGLAGEAAVRSFVESYPPTACARASLVNEKKFRWKRTLTSTEAQGLVEPLGVGRLVDVEVLGRGRGGRVTGVRVVGDRGRVDVHRELPVRRLFGNLNSGLFVLDVERDPKGRLTALRFTGGGWGHGVGMCQMGAIGRAEHGHDFGRILDHYYSGARVERIYE